MLKCNKKRVFYMSVPRVCGGDPDDPGFEVYRKGCSPCMRG